MTEDGYIEVFAKDFIEVVQDNCSNNENIKIFLSQYASIKFDYVENKINTYV